VIAKVAVDESNHSQKSVSSHSSNSAVSMPHDLYFSIMIESKVLKDQLIEHYGSLGDVRFKVYEDFNDDNDETLNVELYKSIW